LSATVVLWAAAFPAIRVGVEGLGVAGLSVLRLGIAAMALAIVAPLFKVRLPRRGDLPQIALCGASGMTAYQLLLNLGEVRVPAGTASLLISMAPVFSVLLAAGFLGERLTGHVVVGSAIALGGSAVIAFGGGAGRVSASALIVLAAAVVQGVYHCASKPLLRRYTGFEVACYAMWSGTLFVLPVIPLAMPGLVSAEAGSAATWSAVLLGLAPSALGFVTWGYAVARCTVGRATAALYLVPPVAIVVAFGWLGEAPAPIELAGGAVGIAGVLVAMRRARPTSRGPSTPPDEDARRPGWCPCRGPDRPRSRPAAR
jgi:drug/metabolite transporter (DMT)-like permease